MSDPFIQTSIGSDVDVKVFFDYMPEEKQTFFDPGCASMVMINAVLVDGDEGKDILDELSGECIGNLSTKCIEDYEQEPDEDGY